MKKIYIIYYISSYKYLNPCDPVFEILDDLFFTSYKKALDYAKKKRLCADEYEILDLIKWSANNGNN